MRYNTKSKYLAWIDSSAFNHVYNKKNGGQANAYLLGLHAADYMIINAKPLNHDTRNED